MTGTKTTRASRGRYVSAGYAHRQGQPETRGRELYIADDPAGSARENLRDLNRPGYRGDRARQDTPSPAFQTPEAERPRTAATKRAAAKRPMGLIDRLIVEVRRDHAGVAACVLLAATMLVMAVAWGRNMVDGVTTQRSIESYQTQTATLVKENEMMQQQLTAAESGDRIRNRAQNELGMLRRERAQTETIYIQAPEKKAQDEAQALSENHMEILDFLLGLLNVFHIGE